MIEPAGYDAEVILDDETIIADAKLMAERYLTYEGPYSQDDFDSFVEKCSIFEFRVPYEGLFEFPDCFYVDVTPDWNALSEKQRWFIILFHWYIDNCIGYIPPSLCKNKVRVSRLSCSRCGDDIEPGDFYDRNMCAECNEQVYGVNIDNCVVCCDVNYIGREGRCIICDMEYDMDEPMDEDQCASCSSTLDEEGYCDGCGWSR